MSTKKVKARKMWKDRPESVWSFSVHHEQFKDFQSPVYVLPATPEAYEQMVEQGAASRIEGDAAELRQDAILSLAAIGITQPKKSK
jgi:hypothetical protein